MRTCTLAMIPTSIRNSQLGWLIMKARASCSMMNVAVSRSEEYCTLRRRLRGLLLPRDATCRDGWKTSLQPPPRRAVCALPYPKTKAGACWLNTSHFGRRLQIHSQKVNAALSSPALCASVCGWCLASHPRTSKADADWPNGAWVFQGRGAAKF